jgi:hypothetical protein
MSYRLIDANALNGVISNDDYEKVLNASCIYADIPNGLNGDFYDLSVYPKIVENLEQPTVNVLEQIQAEIYETFMTIDGGVHDKSALKCMEIIDKYR